MPKLLAPVDGIGGRHSNNLLVTKTIDAGAGFRHGSSSQPSWTVGMGTPEGAVAAPVGSLYSRTDGGPDTTFYRKESGTDSGGWVATSGGGAVSSVDGRTGDVVLGDLYINTAGDTMAGNLGLGQASPTAKLHFSPATDAAGGVAFGADTNLYRSAVSTLATDGALRVGSTATASAVAVFGLTGATAASRYVGATDTGAPTFGTFNAGDYVVARDGGMYVCTTAGSPGTWKATGGVTSVDGRTGVVTLADSYLSLPNGGSVAGATTFTNTNGLTIEAPLTITKSAVSRGKLWADASNNLGLTSTVAAPTGSNNTFVGAGSPSIAITTGSDNTFVGYNTGPIVGTQGLAVAIGKDAKAAASGVTIGGLATATAAATYGVAVGGNAQAAGASSVALGPVSWANAQYGLALGASAYAGGTYAIAIGRNVGANYSGSIAIGTDSGGAAASPQAINDIALGTANHNVKILGTLAVSKAVNGLNFRQGAAGPLWSSGTGSPEGVVTAPVGSMFSRTDGSTDTTLYRKESGSGSTGWVAVAAGAAGDAYVSPSPPAGTPVSGDLWFDTDEVSSLVLPLSVAQGGTGASNAGTARTNLGVNLPLGLVDGGTGGTSAATARTALAVPSIGNSTTTAGAPTTGTWARGDQYLDSNNIVWTCTVAGTPGTWVPPSGYELAYDQITTSVQATSTDTNNPTMVIAGTARNYDGSPIIVEFYSSRVDAPTNGQMLVTLWDGSTGLGFFFLVLGTATGVSVGAGATARRRIVPSSGSHTFSIRAAASAATGGYVNAGLGNATGTFSPAYLRITRA